MDEPRTPYNIGKSPSNGGTQDLEEPESVGSNNVISSGLEEQLSSLNIDDKATPSPASIGFAGPNSVAESTCSISKLKGYKLRESINEWENSDESSCSSFVVSTMSDVVDENLWNGIFPVPPSVEDKRIGKKRLRKLKREKGVRKDSDIIKSLEKFYNDYLQNKRTYNSLKELKEQKTGFEDHWQVRSMDKKEVCSEIRELYEPFIEQKQDGVEPCFVLKKDEKVVYVEELECYVLKGRSEYHCKYDPDPKSVFMRIHCLLHLIHRLLMEDITVNIRWIPYAFRFNFDDTSKVEYVLERLCKHIGCSRDSLNIFASGKGRIAGNISMKVTTRGGRSYITNCQGGISIEPREVVAGKFKFRKMSDDKMPLLIVVVEKDTIFQRLLEENFHMRFRCIIITGCGMPDVATRTCLRQAQTDLDVPGVAFTDHNADGFNIYLTYLCGSENMAHENLSTPYIKWLGLSPSDLIEHDIPIGDDVKVRELDIIKNKDFVMHSPDLAVEVGKMETKVDAESLMKEPSHLKYWTAIYLHATKIPKVGRWS